jgi:hypothetical protein
VVEREGTPIDPVGGRTILDERVAAEGSDERTLADVALAHEDELGLVLRDGLIEAPEVGEQFWDACPPELRQRLGERVVLEAELDLLVEFAQTGWQRGEVVAVEREERQVFEPADRLRQLGELVASQVELRETGECRDRTRVRDLVVRQIQEVQCY